MSEEQPPSGWGWSPDQPPPSREGYAGTTPPPGPDAPPSQPPPTSPPPAAAPAPTTPPPPAPPPGWGPPPAPPPTPGWGAVPRADQPGVIPLQPLGLGQIYEAAFATVRQTWRAVGTVAGLLAVLVFVVSLLTWLSLIPASQTLADQLDALNRLAPGEAPSSSQLNDLGAAFVPFAGTFLLLALVLFVVNLVVTGATTAAVGRAVIGKPVTAKGLWRELRPRLLPLIGTALLVGLGVFGGLLLCLVPGLIFAVFWLVATPAVVLERCGPVTAMRRSWRLVRGSWWRVLGIFALTYLITAVLAGAISAPLQALAGAGQMDQIMAGASSGAQFLPTTGLAAFSYALSQALTVLIAIPLLSCVLSLLYIDLRMRKENLGPALSAAARADDPTR
jgi:hypothetical protein